MGLCNDHFVIDPLSPRKSIGRHLPPNPADDVNDKPVPFYTHLCVHYVLHPILCKLAEMYFLGMYL